MAKIYYEKLSELITRLKLDKNFTKKMQVKHFFSGAAIYINDNICITWSPVGLAFKLPDTQVDKLINKGQAKPLKYFSKGHIKKGYVLFDSVAKQKPTYWKKYFIAAAEYADEN